MKVCEVCCISPSVLFKKSSLVSQVLQAELWEFLSTFSAFYFWNVTHKPLDTFSIGLMATLQVMQSWVHNVISIRNVDSLLGTNAA